MIPAVAVGVGLAAAAAWSQIAAPRIQTTPYFTTPLARLQSVVIPPGASNEFHRHNGDQWTTVQEGQVTFTIKGQAPRTLKVGDSVYIPRGTVYRNQNLTDKPARSIELVIIDYDKPRAEAVTG
jgi:quercetin dioxygenase-like cupin family protein